MQHTEATHKVSATVPRGRAAAGSRSWLRRPLVIMAVFLLVAELGARFVAGHLPPNTPWGFEPIDHKVAQMETLAGAEVVFLGDSVTQAAFDPGTFLAASGRFATAYNASIDGAGGRFLEPWALEVVVPELRPEVVVIGLTSRSFNDNSLGIRTLMARYEESFGRREMLGEVTVIDRIEHRLAEVSDIVGIRSLLRDPKQLSEQWGSQTSPLKALGPLGAEHFPPGRYSIERLAPKVRNRALRDYALGSIDVPALDSLIAALQQMNIGVVLVDMPVVAADYVPLHPHGQRDVDAYEASLQALAAARGVPLVDGAAVLADTSYFVDFYHLNTAGATLLTTSIVDTVEEAAG